MPLSYPHARALPEEHEPKESNSGPKKVINHMQNQSEP